jgi:hypothetical protein
MLARELRSVLAVPIGALFLLRIYLLSFEKRSLNRDSDFTLTPVSTNSQKRSLSHDTRADPGVIAGSTLRNFLRETLRKGR